MSPRVCAGDQDVALAVNENCPRGGNSSRVVSVLILGPLDGAHVADLLGFLACAISPATPRSGIVAACRATPP